MEGLLSPGSAAAHAVGNRQLFAIFSQPIGEVAEWSKAALC